ncbi:MAG: hypothetical protein AAB738_01130 [Patescibacteria group bacterium]
MPEPPKTIVAGLTEAYIRLSELSTTKRTPAIQNLLNEFSQRFLGREITLEDFIYHVAGESAIPSEMKLVLWNKLCVSEISAPQLLNLVRALPETTENMFDVAAWRILRSRKPTASILCEVLDDCKSARIAVAICGFLLREKRITTKIARLIRRQGTDYQKSRVEKILDREIKRLGRARQMVA